MSKDQIKCLLNFANSGDLANLSDKLDDYLSESRTAKVHDIVKSQEVDYFTFCPDLVI